MSKNVELIEKAIEKGWLELGLHQHRNIRLRNDYWDACTENNKYFILTHETDKYAKLEIDTVSSNHMPLFTQADLQKIWSQCDDVYYMPSSKDMWGGSVIIIDKVFKDKIGELVNFLINILDSK